MAIKVKCPLCNAEFDNVHSLFSHMLTTHCDEKGYFVSADTGSVKREKCPYCGAEFDSTEKLMEHIIEKHRGQLLNDLLATGQEELAKQLFGEEVVEEAKEVMGLQRKKRRKKNKTGK